MWVKVLLAVGRHHLLSRIVGANVAAAAADRGPEAKEVGAEPKAACWLRRRRQASDSACQEMRGGRWAKLESEIPAQNRGYFGAQAPLHTLAATRVCALAHFGVGILGKVSQVSCLRTGQCWPLNDLKLH